MLQKASLTQFETLVYKFVWNFGPNEKSGFEEICQTSWLQSVTLWKPLPTVISQKDELKKKYTLVPLDPNPIFALINSFLYSLVYCIYAHVCNI